MIEIKLGYKLVMLRGHQKIFYAGVLKIFNVSVFFRAFLMDDDLPSMNMPSVI